MLLKHKPLETLSLNGAKVEVARDYVKKEHVFRLILENGGQYLLRAKDDNEMNTWINRVQNAINNAANGQTSTSSTGGIDLSKTKSLPPPDKQRSTGSLSGPGGPSGSLKKDYYKK